MIGGTRAAHIADALRHDILSGLTPPGTPVREEQLAARFSASRHTVRSALAQLAGTGLVDVLPYRGARVIAFDPAAATALQELRRALESEAVAILVERHRGGRWPDDVRSPIEAAIDELAAAEAAGDQAAILTTHAAVHLAIVAAAGSPRIVRAHRQLTDELHLLLLHARDRYAAGELEQQHRTLLDALERDGAEPMRRHLADTLHRLGTETGVGHEPR